MVAFGGEGDKPPCRLSERVQALHRHFRLRERRNGALAIGGIDAHANAAVRAELTGDGDQLAWDPRRAEDPFGAKGMACARHEDDRVGGAQFASVAISRTAASAVSMASEVVNGPGAKRTVPMGKVPIVLWAAGAQ